MMFFATVFWMSDPGMCFRLLLLQQPTSLSLLLAILNLALGSTDQSGVDSTSYYLFFCSCSSSFSFSPPHGDSSGQSALSRRIIDLQFTTDCLSGRPCLKVRRPVKVDHAHPGRARCFEKHADVAMTIRRLFFLLVFLFQRISLSVAYIRRVWVMKQAALKLDH